MLRTYTIEDKTFDVYLASVRQNGLALELVPENKFPDESYEKICLTAMDQNINAKSSIGASLDAKIAALQARLEALDGAGQPAYAGAYALAA